VLAGGRLEVHAGDEGTYRVGAGGAMHVAMGAQVGGGDAGAGVSGSRLRLLPRRSRSV
jgi:hypothetical protein